MNVIPLDEPAVLHQQAEAFRRGEDPTAELVSLYAAEAPELVALLRLAQRLRGVLAPAVVPGRFRQRLQHRLTRPMPDERPRWMVWGGAAVMMAAGLFVWWRRRSPAGGSAVDHTSMAG